MSLNAAPELPRRGVPAQSPTALPQQPDPRYSCTISELALTGGSQSPGGGEEFGGLTKH